MKRFTFLKAFMLSCFMAAVSLLPMSLNAQQTSDDFFKVDDSFNGNRDAIAITGISNYGIGESAPVGSGLLILTAAGAGYAIVRRRKNAARATRKGVTLMLACALLLGMTQCKKNVDTISDVTSNGVRITLNVGGGEKVIVNPTGHTSPDYATVTFEEGDKIYVGNNGKYCGYLTYVSANSRFEGDVNPESTADYLHFYFLGNKAGNLTNGATECTFNIIDQTSKYPVISYGHSTSLYNSGTTEYDAKLFNKCAIRKFNTTDIDKAITITGMKNTVTVNFAANNGATTGEPYSFSKSGNGEIKLHAESNDRRWAILLPQPEVTTATAYAAGYSTTSTFTVPEVVANGYYDTPVAVTLTPGSTKGAFTINASGDQVFFAPGNLQYQASTNTWRFAENQWDYVGSDNSNISSSYSGWIDLFGWGTSGYNHGAVAYQPYNTNTSNTDYYAYGVETYSLYDRTGEADWGYSASATSLNGYTNWRTLKGNNQGSGSEINLDAEWYYILKGRVTSSNVKFAKATVNSVKGVILLPDNWNNTYYNLNSANTGTADFAVNSITSEVWANAFEVHGAVFLPAAGYRINTSVSKANSAGLYWSSTSANLGYDGTGNSLYITSGNLQPSYWNNNRYIGSSVRLVRPL